MQYGVVELFPDNDETRAFKTRFAGELLRNPDQAFGAAQMVFGADTGRALFAAQNWINDDFVTSERARLLRDKGARAFLPNKEDYAREIWRMATDARTPIEEKRKFLDLYGDVMGHKERPQQGGINLNVTQNRVMIVKEHGSADEWEAAAKAQQFRLANGAVTDVPHRTVQ